MDSRYPRGQAKHFLVSRVIQSELANASVVSVEIEAVFSKATQVIAWRDLQDEGFGGGGGFEVRLFALSAAGGPWLIMF